MTPPREAEVSFVVRGQGATLTAEQRTALRQLAVGLELRVRWRQEAGRSVARVVGRSGLVVEAWIAAAEWWLSLGGGAGSMSRYRDGRRAPTLPRLAR